jgi:hypothetical protein
VAEHLRGRSRLLRPGRLANRLGSAQGRVCEFEMALLVGPASSGCAAICSASAFSIAPASSSPSWIMTRSHFRGGGTSLASIFSSMRSIREALGFMAAGSLPRSACSSHGQPG